ncbi:hypothetical protein BD289DRAFT_483899 [Coniella lustricola]|uniref:precorrin-2 dehydrogenase n=1 Tax=Coniella lustricola TaxID=2025994 RepID=A0A2T3A3Y9_9PEZI|nr:hypothetical protein BD289DRAFT_483899 [Coniella lustricola]
MAEDFPKVEGGGSLILAWQIRGKRVLVIGGGEVAAGRILNCLNADALVTVICPREGLNPEVAHRVALGQVTHIDRKFVPSDLDPSLSTTNTTTTTISSSSTTDQTQQQQQSPQTQEQQPPSLVLTAIDDPITSSEIYTLCHRLRIPANIADVPPECDFYFGSVHRDGPLQIMVSTNGKGPRLAATIRKSIAASLPPRAGEAIKKVGKLRQMLRKVEPGKEVAVIGKRMGWMIGVSDRYTWETFADMTEEDMANLVGFYQSGEPLPELEVLKGMREGEQAVWEFDGSFGFSVGC